MLPYHRLPEENVGRRRAQFSKDERLHLLAVMARYEPLLDDRHASVFDRREIWRAIERDFHRAGFARKTPAQLKKYWQNYKYHGRRAQANKIVKKRSASRDSTKETAHPGAHESRGNLEATEETAEESAAPAVPATYPGTSLRNTVVESGCRQREIYGDNGTVFRILSAASILPTDLDSCEKNRSAPEIAQRKRISSEIYEESRSPGAIDRKSERPAAAGTDVIVSNTDVSDNSVTVSVICPERAPELFSRSQPKRKRDGDASLDGSSFHSRVSVASAASPGKKHEDDEQHFIFPSVKGRCFLLQPRQPDNHGEVISDRRDAAVETRRKLEPARKTSVVLPSTFASRNDASESATRITAGSLLLRDLAAPRVREPRCRGGRCDESTTRRTAASRNQRDDLDEDRAARPRVIPNAGLWDRDTIESELPGVLNYQLMLHRLETEEKRLKVKLAEMAIQEIRFRIRAVSEDIRRADELHELQLALAAARAVNQDAQGLHA